MWIDSTEKMERERERIAKTVSFGFIGGWRAIVGGIRRELLENKKS